MIYTFSLGLINFGLFILLILYMCFRQFDLILCAIFTLERQNELTFCQFYSESYFYSEISVTFYATDAYYHRTVA